MGKADGKLRKVATFDVTGGPLQAGDVNVLDTGSLFMGTLWTQAGAGTGRYFGDVDEVIITKDVEPHEEPTGSNTVGIWHMDENSGTVLVDSSIFGNDMEIIGNDWSWDSNGIASGSPCIFSPNDSNTFATVDLQPWPSIWPPEYHLTAEAWIKPTGRDSDGSQIIGQGDYKERAKVHLEDILRWKSSRLLAL